MRSVLRDCVRDEGESDRASLDAARDTASLDAALHTASLDTVHDRTSLHATHDIASLHLDAARDTASLDAAYRARLDRRRDAVVADPRLPPTVCPSLARPHRDLVRRQLAAGNISTVSFQCRETHSKHVEDFVSKYVNQP